MTPDLSQLRAALALVYAEPRYRDFIGAETRHQSVELILAAARLVERLLPGECENCESKGHVLSISMDRVNAGIGPPRPVYMTCPVCHGSGQVWDEGIVEAVAKAIYGAVYPDREMVKPRTQDFYKSEARAVLSALAQLFPPAGG